MLDVVTQRLTAHPIHHLIEVLILHIPQAGIIDRFHPRVEREILDADGCVFDLDERVGSRFPVCSRSCGSGSGGILRGGVILIGAILVGGRVNWVAMQLLVLGGGW